MFSPPPPPTPPAPVPVLKSAPVPISPKPPVVTPTGPPGASMIELLIYNGSPFKDHWTYWVRSHTDSDIGVQMHAAGDVMHGFEFQIQRSHSFRAADDYPTNRVPLQWVDGKYFDEKVMLNDGKWKVDDSPVCGFEESAYKVKVPEKSLNAVDDKLIPVTSIGKKITQRNCQTWIIMSADQLVKDGIFNQEVAVYLHAIEQ